MQQVSADSFTAETTYQLSINLGCNQSGTTGTGAWTVTLGTWDGATFTPLSGAAETWNLSKTTTGSGSDLSFVQGTEVTRTFQFTTSSTPPTGPVAIQISIDGALEWMGADNVAITEVIPSDIVNHSFEVAPGGGTPTSLQNAAPEGWTRTLNSGSEGVYYNAVSSDQTWSYAFGPSTIGYIAQVTDVTIVADAEYTIVTDFARNSSGGTANFNIEAWANGVQIDSVSSELKHQGFLAHALHLTTSQLSTYVGQKLEIRIGRSGGDQWLGLDNVRITTRDKDTMEIMILGDSITQGRDNGNYSYRYELWKDLVDLGIDFDMVGSHNFTFDGPASAGAFPDYMGKSFDRDNEGHWNWDTDQVLNGYSESTLTSYSPTPSTGTETLSVWLKGYQPDYVLIALGRNDCNRNHGAANYATRMGQIIDAIQADNPNVTIFLASILDANTGGDEASYNAELPGLAASKTTSTSLVLHADIGNISGQTIFNASSHTYDNTHPNTSGEVIVADHWDAVLTPYLTTQDINIAATDDTATEVGNTTGTVRVEIPFNHKSRIVNYTLSGTTTQTADYTLSSETITVPANVTSVDIDLTPVSDTEAEGDETIILTATSGVGYGAGGPQNSSTVTLSDHAVEEQKISAFGSVANANLPAAQDDADWDRDGINNLTEIATGTDPASSSQTPDPTASHSGTDAVFSYSVSTSALGLTVTPYYSTTLQTLSWNFVPTVNLTGTSGGMNHYEAIVTSAGDRTFFRLEVAR